MAQSVLSKGPGGHFVAWWRTGGPAYEENRQERKRGVQPQGTGWELGYGIEAQGAFFFFGVTLVVRHLSHSYCVVLVCLLTVQSGGGRD